jgi:hypothetical protein
MSKSSQNLIKKTTTPLRPSPAQASQGGFREQPQYSGKYIASSKTQQQ